MHWKDLIKYKDLIPNMDPLVVELFDTMMELVPIEENRDRLGTFLKWKNNCKDQGIITPNEESRITNEMIHGCGGL